MRSGNSLFMMVVGLAFVAMGIAALIRSEDPFLPAIAIVFFGSVAAFGVKELIPVSRPEEGPDGVIRVHASRLRAGIVMLGGLAFALTGAALLWAGGFDSARALSWVALLAIPFGALAAAVTAPSVLSRQLLMVADASGLQCGAGLKWRLDWAEIADVRVQMLSGMQVLEIDTIAGAPEPAGWRARLNRFLGKPPYSLASGASGVDFNILADIIADKAGLQKRG